MINPAELILRPSGRIYHLDLLPDEVSPLIITVGDPDRVSMVTSRFSSIEVDNQKREFITQTGHYKGKRITVISTGIGTDNIDIVFNELDALFNIDFKTRGIKKEFTPLTLIRVGTSGSLQPDIPVDSFVASEGGWGLDNLMHFYRPKPRLPQAMFEAWQELTSANGIDFDIVPYFAVANPELLHHFGSDAYRGITVTAPGFYGPQGRQLRLSPRYKNLLDILGDFKSPEGRFTNFEMETSAIYGMADALGHRALSLNAILANRPQGTFSENSRETVYRLIDWTLDRLITL